MPLFVRILVALLVLSPLARAVPIATFHQFEDGEDWSPAFDRAQLAGAVQVELEARAYELSRTIEICSPMRIVGEGIGAVLTSTSFRIARRTGIRSWFKNQGCPIVGKAAGNGALAMEHVVFFQTGGLSVDGEEPFYGLDAKTGPRLNDVWFRGFVQGIRLVCDAASEGTNCNTFTVTHSGTDQNEHAGVYMQGGDSNAGHFLDMSVIASCSKAEKWKHLTDAWCHKYATHPVCTDPHFQCAGFLDLSFLGNTYLACSAATMHGHAGYAFGGNNQTNAAVGIYAEIDTAPQYGDTRSNVLGGTNTFAGGTGQFHGALTSGLTIQNGELKMDMGYPTGMPGVVWSIGNTFTGPWPWRFKLNASTGDLSIDVGNKGARLVGDYDQSGTYSVTIAAGVVIVALLLFVYVRYYRKPKPPKPPPKPPRKDDEAPPSGAEPTTTPDDESPP